ncbi:zf-HC2 domain-containing protein [Paenibacillus hamazuiensis]|uniref:zf-HC2 domain-containing protein n=1 Tax=Paenibacillus hamazuiensis TaxID=2936508 RepID=UPI00200D364A|nr:zf-HC2 domain-containing protein [Paenibacillus hamazuiensis]
MECKEALPMMHEYLDGDLEGANAARLKEHLLVCPDCKKRFRELETTEAMIMASPDVKAPPYLKDRIMLALPPVKSNRTFGQWFRRHPAVSVAAVFVLVMMGSFMSLWNEDTELLVKGNNLDQVVIKGDTVYVPPGHTVSGNLTVQSGKLQVDGDINGNLVVIDGSVNLASTAHISGQVTKIDEAFEWMWFKVSEFFTQLSD